MDETGGGNIPINFDKLDIFVSTGASEQDFFHWFSDGTQLIDNTTSLAWYCVIKKVAGLWQVRVYDKGSFVLISGTTLPTGDNPILAGGPYASDAGDSGTFVVSYLP